MKTEGPHLNPSKIFTLKPLSPSVLPQNVEKNWLDGETLINKKETLVHCVRESAGRVVQNRFRKVGKMGCVGSQFVMVGCSLPRGISVRCRFLSDFCSGEGSNTFVTFSDAWIFDTDLGGLDPHENRRSTS